MYNGIERNEEFGLNIYTADFRSYDPAIGRWMQVDPLADIVPEMNPYRFGFNNPLLFRDPLGLMEEKEKRKKRVKGVERERTVTYDDNGIPTGVRIGYSQNFASINFSFFNFNFQSGGGFNFGNDQTNTSPDNSANQQTSRWDREVGLGESLIPVWGSARMAVKDYREGRYGWAAVNTLMAASDVFLVKSLIVGVGKVSAGILWKTGSNKWRATRSWMGRTGQAEKGQEVHHWLLHRNQGIGRNVADNIKNQPWNLIPMPKNPHIHDAIHGTGPLKGRQIPYLLWYGTPDYFKGTVSNVTSTTINEIRKD